MHYWSNSVDLSAHSVPCEEYRIGIPKETNDLDHASGYWTQVGDHDDKKTWASGVPTISDVSNKFNPAVWLMYTTLARLPRTDLL